MKKIKYSNIFAIPLRPDLSQRNFCCRKVFILPVTYQTPRNQAVGHTQFCCSAGRRGPPAIFSEAYVESKHKLKIIKITRGEKNHENKNPKKNISLFSSFRLKAEKNLLLFVIICPLYFIWSFLLGGFRPAKNFVRIIFDGQTAIGHLGSRGHFCSRL